MFFFLWNSKLLWDTWGVCVKEHAVFRFISSIRAVRIVSCWTSFVYRNLFCIMVFDNIRSLRTANIKEAQILCLRRWNPHINPHRYNLFWINLVVTFHENNEGLHFVNSGKFTWVFDLLYSFLCGCFSFFHTHFVKS